MKRAIKILKEIERLKKLYAELDEVTDKLVKEKFKENKDLILIDNFKTRNTAWKATAFRRYELKLRGVK